jgi:hypothetical protein
VSPRVRRIFAAALIAFAAAAAAEHEADHRYDVRGYVLSADKRPLDATVTIRVGDEVIGAGRTDGEGYYAIQLHLHDGDIGKTFAVRAGERNALIRMQADYGDRTTARVHHVNFVGSEVIEKNLSTGIPIWAYFAAAPLLLWGAVSLNGVIRRKVRKAALASAPEAPGREKKRRGKRKR